MTEFGVGTYTRNVVRALSDIFPIVEVATIPLAMYPGNWWTFSIGAMSLDPKVARNPFGVETRIYSRDAHEWFFIPRSVREKHAV